MKFKMLAFFFLLLCTQFISSLVVESKDEKDTTNSYDREDGMRRDELVLSKASKGKGAYGGQNDHPPNTNKSGAFSMLIKQPTAYISLGVTLTCIILVSPF